MVKKKTTMQSRPITHWQHLAHDEAQNLWTAEILFEATKSKNIYI